MEENNPIREIGGSRFNIWLGNWFARLSKKHLDKGGKKILSNPTSKFINPFTLIITFTMNNIDKYQVTLVNDYKDKFKEFKAKELKAAETQLKFDIIKHREIMKNNDDKKAETMTDDEIRELIDPVNITVDAIDNREMFIVILSNTDKWFLKK